MEKPIHKYMELNSPEEQAEAAKLLLWDWSSAAIHALTTYSRSSYNELTRINRERDLLKFLGASDHTLLDVQRELGGIILDYGNSHWLNFDIFGDEEFLQEYGRFFFALESNGVPAQFIDAQGRIHDDDAIFSNAQKFVEWYVALRNFSLNLSGDNTLYRMFETHDRSFSYVKGMAANLAEKLFLSIQTQATDDRNLMWIGIKTELTVKQLINGKLDVWIYTTEQKIIDLFTDWCEQVLVGWSRKAESS
ncbi:hypothetical protein [Deinococcus sp. UYEF24]